MTVRHHRSGAGGFLRLFVTLFLLVSAISWAVADQTIPLNLRDALSSGDLAYTEPATRSEEGVPVGNGRMGSLVWTTPSAIKFQVNRVDVFGQDRSTVSFPRGNTDYASGCGYVDINLVQAGDDVFAGKDFRQHLSVYDGVMTVAGKVVTARVIGWPKADVMAIEIDDQRANPEPVSIDLRMLRYMMQYHPKMNYPLTQEHAVMVQTANHTATSRLGISDGRITLTQEFRELEFYDSSAIAIGIEGRGAKARYLNDSTVQLVAAPGRGKFTILIASAASFDEKQDTAALALANLNAAVPKDFSVLLAETSVWWHDFWAEGFVAMSSHDKQADFVGGAYTYFMYLMNASSHGAYPPRFGGMLWCTNGDMRMWGAQYWQSNNMALYRDLISSSHLDLMDPLFSMYFGMHDACALAARQQWGSQGIYLPETTFFNGPDVIPDPLVKEFQDLFLVHKPYEQRSAAFDVWVQTKSHQSSRYNFLTGDKFDHGRLVFENKGKGIFGHTTHFLSGSANIAGAFWKYYEFTLDKEFLRKKGYPMIKGVAEFYRNFPNVEKGADGKYHIHHINNGEGQWNSSDTVFEIGAMLSSLRMAARASEVLGVDGDLRSKWQEIADNLAKADPNPSGGKNTSAAAKSHSAHPAASTAAKKNNESRRSTVSAGNSPLKRNPFGEFTDGPEGYIAPLGSEPELKALFLGFNGVGKFCDAKGSGGAQIFRNRLRLREGPGAIDAEHLGGLCWGIHRSLLLSTATPHADSVEIQVFPAWPKDWDVTFKLLARGACEVTASQQGGQIRFVKLTSRMGGQCNLKNPWSESGVTLYRDGKAAEELSGNSLKIQAKKGEIVTIVPKGAPLTSIINGTLNPQRSIFTN